MRHLTSVSLAQLLLAASAGRGAATCPDCDGDGAVAINELITGIGIALGSAPLSACPALDADADGQISIAELIEVINAALDGCPPAASPTPTPTPGADIVPTDPDALLAWLQASRYLAWPAESHPTPRRVRTAARCGPSSTTPCSPR